MAGEEVSSEFLRFLRIKHKVVQRLAKEVMYYQAEVKQHEATVSRMKAENREPSDIKQQQNVLDETVLMVPDAESRLLRACAELDDYMLSNRVCVAAARSLSAGAAALPQVPLQRQQQQQQQHCSEAGAGVGGDAVATQAGAGGSECYQQQGSSSSDAGVTPQDERGEKSYGGIAQEENQSSNRMCTTEQKQNSSRSNARGTKVDGGADRQGQQLHEEAYEEAHKILETIRRIERDLPHLHVSLCVTDQVTGPGANAAEETEEDDI